MTFSYVLYGLNLRSNIPLPGLQSSDSANGIDLDVTFGALHQVPAFPPQPWFCTPYSEPNGKPYLTVWKSRDDSAFHFVYSDETEFLVDRTGSRVSAIWPDTLNIENTTVYFVGQVAALVLRLRGQVCLHASSILVNNKVLAIAGDTGAGKSSTAAGFAKLGYSILAEDVTTLTDRGEYFLVQPGYPRINLWPEAQGSVQGLGESLPLIAPTWDKTYLDLAETDSLFCDIPTQLGCVYILGARSASDSAPFIEPLSGSDALISLLTQAHGRYLLERPMRLREFEQLTRLSHLIPIRRVVPHADLARLDQLCEAIIVDFTNS